MFPVFLAFCIAGVIATPIKLVGHQATNHCSAPDGTDSGIYWKQTGTGTIQATNINVYDSNDASPEYPINLDSKIYIHVAGSYSGSTTITSVVANVTVSLWGGLFGCNWTPLPTGDKLTNVKVQLPIPITPSSSPISFDLPLDLVPYESMTNMLANGSIVQGTLNANDASTNSFMLAGLVELKVIKLH